MGRRRGALSATRRRPGATLFASRGTVCAAGSAQVIRKAPAHRRLHRGFARRHRQAAGRPVDRCPAGPMVPLARDDDHASLAALLAQVRQAHSAGRGFRRTARTDTRTDWRETTEGAGTCDLEGVPGGAGAAVSCREPAGSRDRTRGRFRRAHRARAVRKAAPAYAQAAARAAGARSDSAKSGGPHAPERPSCTRTTASAATKACGIWTSATHRRSSCRSCTRAATAFTCPFRTCNS